MTTTRPKKKARTAITRSGGYSHQVASARPAPALLRFLLLSLCVSLCVLFLELAPASASPANDKAYALIFGTVWTPEGQPIYGVKVRIRRADDKKPKWKLFSNHAGEFAQRVPAGKNDYIVYADLKDFKSSAQNKLQAGTPVTVHIENDERVDIGLHLTR